MVGRAAQQSGGSGVGELLCTDSSCCGILRPRRALAVVHVLSDASLIKVCEEVAQLGEPPRRADGHRPLVVLHNQVDATKTARSKELALAELGDALHEADELVLEEDVELLDPRHARPTHRHKERRERVDL